MARNIVALRQLLADKFPGVRMSAETAPAISTRWATGLPQFDELLEGGLPKGGITEITSSGDCSGSALFLIALLRQCHSNGEWLALVDGGDSFDPAAMDNTLLSRLLWVRCYSAKEAIKAADLLIHDGTIGLVVLDLIHCPAVQLRKTPASTWFRFQRIVETTSTALIVLSPERMISNADARLILEPRFSIDSLEQDRETLFAQLAPRRAESAGADSCIVKIA